MKYKTNQVRNTKFKKKKKTNNAYLVGVWYMHLKTCVLFFENMCEKTCG